MTLLVAKAAGASQIAITGIVDFHFACVFGFLKVTQFLKPAWGGLTALLI